MIFPKIGIEDVKTKDEKGVCNTPLPQTEKN